jgi:GTP-binding protein HflX
MGRRNGALPVRESVRELARLVRTAGGRVVGTAIQRRQRPDPAHYIGSGKIEEIKAARDESGYTMVVFDDQLSPSQQLKLEGALGVKVLDRSALILDIFASRARTREATLQVELAQHEYLRPRLRGQWQHLERTGSAAGGAAMGAIGARGPGETQLETDRRLIDRRIARLKKEIKGVQKQRALQRSRRDRQGIPVVALVGYTNAGKSSLMRALAGADVLAADAPFATLDPVTRRVGSPHGDAAFLLTDTVGFMQKLPTQLISAFRATLEELNTADLLLHVVDGTSPAVDAQVTTVLETLEQLGLEELPVLTVVNKIDAIESPPADAAEAARLDAAALLAPGLVEGEVVGVSAIEGWGIDALRDRLLYEFFGALTPEAASV